ncbi:YihY/virulence factor BrkB family protein [Pseudooceanicola algae]|uniref:Uncharacterized protein n=1 Tax=Pseudooceanicola algae TaxID=1537215 RepID=A0A418SIT5_9RHOB|nr:YihY/virulence factor BrkB family protein [Pseudooceanicola algae]QPM91100.1 hypothetical protein PSAL_023490 [Pseudooceanicola algae]
MSLRDIWTLIRGIIARMGQLNMGLIAAGVAFYAMLATFPALAATIALWGLISDPDVVLQELQLLQEIIPAEIYSLVEAQIMTLTTSSGSTLGWAGALSLLIAIWSARSGVAALILGLNQIHGEDNRSSLLHYLIAIALTVALIGVAIVTLASVVVVPVVLSFVPLGGLATVLVELARWAAAVLALYVGLSLIYRYGPNNAGARLGWVTPGAAFAVLFWAVASIGFSVYLSNFANYNEVYGSLGAAVAMLFWLYISAFLVLIGAVLNVQLRARQSEAKVNREAADPAAEDPAASPTTPAPVGRSEPAHTA